MKTGLITGADHLTRCWWPGTDPLYLAYHDHEWGRPVTDDHRLFEKLSLEAFQCGLAWITILRKRENFRLAFADFDFEKVALFNDTDRARLVSDPGIVRHRGKIDAVINNAARALELREEFTTLHRYFSFYRPDPATRPDPYTYGYAMENTTSPESVALSKDLKKRGWKFTGPTTAYAFMQATGLVNDHLQGCHCRPQMPPVEAVSNPFPANPPKALTS